MSKLIVIGVVLIFAGCCAPVPNLVGTWRSDPVKTLPRLERIEHLEPHIRRNIRATIGNSEITFGKTNVIIHSLSTNAKVKGGYRVLSHAPDSVTVELLLLKTKAEPTLHFEDDGFWIQSPRYGFREYFKKVKEHSEEKEGA